MIRRLRLRIILKSKDRHNRSLLILCRGVNCVPQKDMAKPQAPIRVHVTSSENEVTCQAGGTLMLTAL